MADKQLVTLTFPAGGIDQRYDYQYQPPGTTPLVSNIWPTQSGTGRQQGATRPGLSKIAASAASDASGGQGHPVQLLTTLTYISSNQIISKLYKAINGKLYYFDDSLNIFTEIAHYGGLSLSTTKTLQAIERNQILYLADHDDTPGTSSSARAPKQYDPSTDTLSAWAATDGTIPYGCPLICLWRDRLLLSGGTTTPYGLYASRQGDPLDWDYSETDVGAAWSLALSQAGQIGQTVTAMIPHADNCLIVGCPNSLWIIRGDPNDGGQTGNLSNEIGIVGRNAWCVTPDGLLVFLSKDGLYAVPAGCANADSPQSLSRERMPIALLDVDPSTFNVSLTYDIRYRGVHIFVTDAGNLSSGRHFFFDWQLKSFWPTSFGDSSLDPFCCHARRNFSSTSGGSSDATSHCVFGCRDGFVRRFHTVTDADDGVALGSYLYFGPFGDAGLQIDSRLDQLDLTVGGVTVTWSIYKGDSAKQAINATTASTGTLLSSEDTGLRHKTLYPRVRGTSLYLALSSATSWQFVAGTLVLAPCGKTRV